ncbi:MAG: ATP-binding protein, partial [Spirochaetales bacterium]|nr:ATP-binding protein [Candidatus Physcosoma equi]
LMYLEELVPGLKRENPYIEFERILKEGKSADSGKSEEIGWLKTIAAFANTDGGDLYVGVDNQTHTIVSLDHDTADKLILMVHRQIKQRLEPSLSYGIDSLPVQENGKTRYVLKISVAKSRILPVMLHEENLLGIYVRNFGSSVLATPGQVRDLVLLSDSVPFDQPFTDEVFLLKDYSRLFSLYENRTGVALTQRRP